MKNIEQMTYSNPKTISSNNKLELLKALEEDFATNMYKIYINSLDQEISFREITAQEQKNLSRILVANENRKDIVYDTQCAIINKTCLTEGFDVSEISEFDRLKILMALYQQNMFADNFKFVCTVCGKENVFKLDFDSVLAKLDTFDLSDKEFIYENKKFKYIFTVAYPTVKMVSEFHKHYFTNNKAANQKDQQILNSIFNNEQMSLFVKKIVYQNKISNKETAINMTDYNVSDYEEIFAMFPQDVIFANNGLNDFIRTNYLNNINKAFEVHECSFCGHKYEDENSNQIESFL